MNISFKDLDNLETHKYPEKSFRKFNDPKHKEYKDYKDRQIEEATDRGFNLGINHALFLLQQFSLNNKSIPPFKKCIKQ